MRSLKNFAANFAAVSGVLLLSALMVGLVDMGRRRVEAQTYPTQNPTYLPQALLQAQTISTVSASTPFNVNGGSVLYLRVLGTNSGLVASVQGTEALRSGVTPNWTNMSVVGSGIGLTGAQSATITGNGLYKVNVAGLSMVRLNVTTLSSGTTIVSWSSGPGVDLVRHAQAMRNSYSAAALIGTGATSHFWSIAGSATATVRVTRAACSGKATAAINVTVTAELTSTADTGDAGTVATSTKHDQNDVAATAVVLSHTTSPTPGTLIGLVRASSLSIANASTPAFSDHLDWDFGTRPWTQEVTLRGVAQAFSLNSSAAFGTGASVGCTFEWTEE